MRIAIVEAKMEISFKIGIIRVLNMSVPIMFLIICQPPNRQKKTKAFLLGK